jgi:ribosomal-protein-alanine N-acetyltransferase
MQRLIAKAEPLVTAVDVMIDRMTEHDLLEVVAIEEASGLSPWGWDAYYGELQLHEHSIMLVARKTQPLPDSSSIIGFIVARRIADEIHINNFAVRPEFRRRGAGQMLLAAVLAWGRKKEARQAVLEVRAGNHAAQKLYATCGFAIVGRRKLYYRSPVEDALLMTATLDSNS